MEPKGSLLHSQVRATCSYPEPAQSSPYPDIALLEDPSEYYPPIYAWVFQMVSFPQFSTPKACVHFSSPLRSTCPPTSFFSIWSPQKYLLTIQISKPLSINFSLFFCYPIPLRPEYHHNTLISDTLSLRSFPIISDQVSHPYKEGKIIVLYILIFG